MRLSTIALAFVPIPLAILPAFASFHPPSGSLVLPSKIVTSSDGLQIFAESAGRKGAPASKLRYLLDVQTVSDATTLCSNLPSRDGLHLDCV